MVRILVLALISSVVAPALAAAQGIWQNATRRIAFDSVVGSQDFFGEDSDWQTIYFLDAYTGIQLDRGFQISFRPVLKRVRGEWTPHIDQLSVRYEVQRGAAWRFEAGRFSSPIGLGMTELRPNQNASVLWWHRPYYMPLPSFGPGLPRASLVSAVYPLGASVHASSTHWDARAAIVDRAPVQFWDGWTGSDRGPNAVVGAGISPRQGLRIGAASAWGHYAAPTATRPAERYVMANVEGEFAINYTRISGEWTRDRFQTPWGNRVASGWTAQVQQTITPRLFLHSRVTAMRSPEAVRFAPEQFTWRSYRSLETTGGYRLSPEVTLRVAHALLSNWGSSLLDNQLGLSLIWARRWW